MVKRNLGETESAAGAEAGKRVHTLDLKELEFKPGSIYRIRMRNFMTYVDCTVTAGPHLNLILGPNGTGKSTIVCALCLGLLGEPKLLERGNNAADFIKHGQQEGTIDLWLVTKQYKLVKITRIIRKAGQDAKNIYMIDDRQKKKADVRKVLEPFNIHVDNLTTFLPQDRVGKFTQCSPVDLLRETQAAIGDRQLIETHNKLIELGKQVRDIETRQKTIETSRNDLQSQKNGLERIVQQYREREQLQEKIDHLKLKLPWAEYDEACALHAEAVATYERTKAHLDQEEKRLQPMQKQKKELETKLNNAKSKQKRVKDQVAPLQRQYEQTEAEMSRLDQSCQRIHTEIDTLREQREEQLLEKEQMEEELAAAQQKLRDTRDADPRQLAQIRKHVSAKNTELTECQRDAQDLRQQSGNIQQRMRQVEHQLQQVEISKSDRVDAIAIKYPQVKAAYDLLMSWQAHNQLRGKWFGPVLAEVTPKDARAAVAFEELMSVDNLTQFIFTDDSDYQRFVGELSKHKWRLTASKLSGKANRYSTLPLHELQRDFGIVDELQNLFEAPQEVKETLLNTAFLSACYVGTDKTENSIEQLASKYKQPFNLITPKSKYQRKIGKYLGTSFLNWQQSKPRAEFLRAVDHQQVAVYRDELRHLEAEHNKLRPQLDQFGTRQNRIMEELNRFKREKAELDEQHRRYQAMASKVERLERDLKAHKVIDIEAKEKQLKKKAAEEVRKFQQKITTVSTSLRQMVELQADLLHLDREVTTTQAELNTVSYQLREMENELLELRRKVQTDKEAANRLAQSARTLKAQAQQACDRSEPRIAQLLESIEEKTVEEIRFAIARAEAARDAIRFQREIIDRYTRICEQLEEMNQTLANATEQLETAVAEIDATEGPWLTRLNDLVEKVARAFSARLALIHIVGDVRLRTNQDRKYEDFGLEIWIKFRSDVPLQILSHQFNSGGERVLATMVFLMALQQILDCPFRVVDEINQGMSVTNEKLVFQQMLELVRSQELPQYFMITPKLLPSQILGEYPEGVTVHVTMNGPFQQCSADDLDFSFHADEKIGTLTQLYDMFASQHILPSRLT